MGLLKSKQTLITTVPYNILPVARLPSPLIFRYQLPLIKIRVYFYYFTTPVYSMKVLGPNRRSAPRNNSWLWLVDTYLSW
jgi:hypothetical protein